MITITTKDPRLISFQTLRKTVGWLGVLLPAGLIIGNVVFGRCTTIQSSISHYYYTATGSLFVGVICSVALFLFCYKGYNRHDRRASLLAGIFAVLVALSPTNVTTMESVNIDRHGCVVFTLAPNPVRNAVHYASAALFFLVLAYMSIFLFTRSLGGKTRKKKIRNKVYRASGLLIILCILLIGLYGLFGAGTSLARYKPVFWLEWLALIAFGFAWLVKGEMFLEDEPTTGPQGRSVGK